MSRFWLKHKLPALSIMLAATVIFGVATGEPVYAYAFLDSGPTGTQSNGYYTNDAVFTFGFYTYGASTGWVKMQPSADFSYSIRQYVGFPKAEGTHTFSFYNNNDHGGDTHYGELCVYMDGSLIDCPASSATDSAHTGLILSKTISFDTQLPQVSLDYPGNNTNTTSDTIKVSGTASDSGSGIDYVTVNGNTRASLDGNKWTATVPLANGLNTLKAFAVDKSGKTSGSNSITVFAQYSSNIGSSTPTAGGSSSQASSATGSGTTGSNDNNNKGDKTGATDQKAEPASKQISTALSSNSHAASWALIGLIALVVLLVAMAKLGLITVDSGKFRRLTPKLHRPKIHTKK